jgi:hypothetical protein
MAAAQVCEFELTPLAALHCRATSRKRQWTSSMIPRSIQSQLARLRRRERLIRLAWGACLWLALVIALLLVCALTDYLIDRDQDTPWSVRYAFFGVQVAAAAVAAAVFVAWPQLRRLRDPELALWVESHESEFEDRLITAVELNRPGARTEGMSEQLIDIVTREAENLSATRHFQRVADHRRLGRGLAIVAPIVVIAAVPLLLWPELSMTLLQRQALADIDVPRLVRLESVSAKVLPVGERFQLRYQVTGPLDEHTVGEVVINAEGQPRERQELTFINKVGDGAIFGVSMPPMTTDFSYTARLADGRTRQPSEMRFVARPVVTRQEAWVMLPAYCGTTPDGKRYEQPQQGYGDVVGIRGSSVRVAIQTSKWVRGGTLEVLGPEHFEPERTEDDTGPEVVKRTVPLAIGLTGHGAEALFELRPDESAYRIVVSDEHGFVNVPAPRRSLRLVPEEPPQVTMLKDYFGPDADSDVEGIPVPIGKAIRVPYVAYGPYGLGQARLLYRVVKKQESGEKLVEPDPWTVLPLPEVVARAESGAFDPKRGIFEHSLEFDQVPFHAVPSADPRVLGRQIGGGRYFLQTGGLKDIQGQDITLHKGDQIEYCVEVFADRDVNAGRPSARSETRVTTIVDAAEWRNWLKAVLREEEQLRKLDQEQRGLFGK